MHLEYRSLLLCFQQQAVGLHIARGLYRRSGIAPCPEGFYLIVEIISQFALTMQSTGQTLTHLGES
jgi:hypothetical protein